MVKIPSSKAVQNSSKLSSILRRALDDEEHSAIAPARTLYLMRIVIEFAPDKDSECAWLTMIQR